MALASVANAMNYLMMIKQTVYAVRRFLGCCGGIAVNVTINEHYLKIKPL